MKCIADYVMEILCYSDVAAIAACVMGVLLLLRRWSLGPEIATWGEGMDFLAVGFAMTLVRFIAARWEFG